MRFLGKFLLKNKINKKIFKIKKKNENII